jgi:two-component system, OmpR family, alkaline phosphatase synthesis response regulator PhoP
MYCSWYTRSAAEIKHKQAPEGWHFSKAIFKSVKNIMNKKILIVDDEAHIRMLIEQTLEDLEDEGVEFFTADNGEAALEIIQAEKPDLVFLDVMMPKMNGMDVCRKVKQELELSDVFIILLTAKGQELDRQRGHEVGANIYMTKPFDPEMLLNKAREVLGFES